MKSRGFGRPTVPAHAELTLSEDALLLPEAAVDLVREDLVGFGAVLPERDRGASPGPGRPTRPPGPGSAEGAEPRRGTEAQDAVASEIPEEQCRAVEDLLEGCVVIWHPFENTIVDNVVEDSRVADLAVGTIDIAGSGDTTDTLDNCFSGNTYTTSLPEQIETLVPCEGAATGTYEAPLGTFGAIVLAEKPAGLDYKTVTLPTRTDLPDKPNAKTAKARPATHEPSIKVVLKKVKTPAAPQ